MANLHTRSNSLPSNSHPAINDVEDRLCRLKSSAAASTSASSACTNLANLTDLQEGINNLIQLSSIQQTLSSGRGEKWTSEFLDDNLGLVELCEFARDVVCLTKESVQELQSSIRRNRCERATSEDIKAYMASRNKISKSVNKFMKRVKIFSQNSEELQNEDSDLKKITGMLKEAKAFGFSVLKSILVLVTEAEGRSKQRGWSFISKIAPKSRLHSEIEQDLEQLKSTEMTIHELEEGLESFFRSLVKTRASLLNVFNH